jgi:hypothetical protein
MMSAYSSKRTISTQKEIFEEAKSEARSKASFKSYKTDDSNASCLFVTQL